MNPKQTPQDKSSRSTKDSEGMLEKIAKTIDPAGTEVTDDEIMDPGANTRDFSSQQDKANRTPSRPKQTGN